MYTNIIKSFDWKIHHLLGVKSLYFFASRLSSGGSLPLAFSLIFHHFMLTFSPVVINRRECLLSMCVFNAAEGKRSKPQFIFMCFFLKEDMMEIYHRSCENELREIITRTYKDVTSKFRNRLRMTLSSV